MAAVKFTASTASGYMTAAMYDMAVGPFRCFTAHYSSPGTTSQYVTPGLQRVVFPFVENADATTIRSTSNTSGGVDVVWSGLAANSTGYIFILGW